VLEPTSHDLCWHRAACHCGAVVVEVAAPAEIEAVECNCSICRQTGFLHLIVPVARFRMVSGREALSTYRFNTGIAQHYFCAHCGGRPFYVPRSNPDGFSVNVRCIDRTTVRGVTIKCFDGDDWERNAGALSHLSREEPA